MRSHYNHTVKQTARLRLLALLILGMAGLCLWPIRAAPAFHACEIEGQGTKLIFCDLDGDGLQDAVLLSGTNGSIYFQDPRQGFARQPQQQFRLEAPGSVIWPARLGRKAESLLVMTRQGVTELCFTNRTNPPLRRQLIQQPSIIPDHLEDAQVMSLPLSAKTGGDWPLILVPVAGGLQIWQHHETAFPGADANAAAAWRQVQFIPQAVDTRVLPTADNDGYTRSFGLSLCLEDVNRDGRDDLMIQREMGGGMQVFSLYWQNTNGQFDVEPAFSYTNQDDWHTILAWMDIRRGGRLDLIKSTVSDEPSFVPGLPSGKVLVAAYLADDHGRLPAQPQQVFRKHDWSAFSPMVDVDGDGYADLVLGYVPIDSRDGLRDMITEGTLGLTLKFHFFRAGQGFSADADCQRQLHLYFDNVLDWTLGERFYFEKFVSLNGDFNGDGRKDLLVRDRKDAISVYFFVSREAGFSPQADLEFRCPELMDWWMVQDLNGDGVSDLVVKLRDKNLFRIYLSHGK